MKKMADRIKHLREHLNLSQSAMGALLGYSELMIEKWEGGEEPHPQALLRLGNVAGEPSCWQFWKAAKLYTGDLVPMLPAIRLEMTRHKRPEMRLVHAGTGALFSKPTLLAIPILPLRVAAVGAAVGDVIEELNLTQPEGLLAAPASWTPNPKATSCLTVRGDSMEPIVREGDLVFIDTSQNDPAELQEKMVISHSKTRGLALSWLRDSELVPENPKYTAVPLSFGSQIWKIIAKVLWYIGRDG